VADVFEESDLRAGLNAGGLCSAHSSWRAEDKFVIYLRPSWGRGAASVSFARGAACPVTVASRTSKPPGALPENLVSFVTSRSIRLGMSNCANSSASSSKIWCRGVTRSRPRFAASSSRRDQLPVVAWERSFAACRVNALKLLAEHADGIASTR
jgi:hypothetical protein